MPAHLSHEGADGTKVFKFKTIVLIALRGKSIENCIVLRTVSEANFKFFDTRAVSVI